MKAQLRDKSVLESLQPADIVGYLRSRGWRERLAADRLVANFELSGSEIRLPLSTSFRDYALRVSEALAILEEVEQRDQLQILADLVVASADVIRIKESDAADGTLSLQRAADLVRGAQELMLAAACSTIQPRLFHPPRKPQLALDYMRSVRLGHTERGSFVFTVLARVPPQLLQSHEQDSLGIPEPFERRVTETLASALTSIQRASYHVLAREDLAPFEEAVQSGVSANLCAALAELAGAGDQRRGIDIALSWARTRASPQSTNSSFAFGSDLAPVLREAARVLTQKAPREGFELVGPIYRLDKKPGAVFGEITVFGKVDEGSRSVWVALPERDYQSAVEAHKLGKWFRATGELRKENRRYVLHNAFGIVFLEMPDDV